MPEIMHSHQIAAKSGETALTERQQVRLSNRTWIIGRIEVLLDGFYRADLDEVFSDAAKIEWADVLEHLPRKSINNACIDYHRSGPRSKSGKLIKPAAGDIYRLAVRFAPKPKIVEPEREEERPEPSAESKARVQAMANSVGRRLRRVDNFYG